MSFDWDMMMYQGSKNSDFVKTNFLCDDKSFILPLDSIVGVAVFISRTGPFTKPVNPTTIQSIQNQSASFWIMRYSIELETYIEFSTELTNKLFSFTKNSMIEHKTRFAVEIINANQIVKIYNTICEYLPEHVSSKPLHIVTTRSVIEDGCSCRVCKNWCYMASADGPDGKMFCWNCATYRPHLVRAMKGM